ncbi:MAG: hypothetical protein AAF039_07925 [Bacteroidota bacterium]
MKKVKLLAILCLLVSVGRAQKVIEKNLNYEGQFIEMNTAFAFEIDVKTWDKPNVYFKATLSSEYPELLEFYDVKISEGADELSIVSDTKAFFEAYNAKRKKEKKYWSSQEKKYWSHEYEFNYVLYVPKKAKFMIKSINGSVTSDEIEGDFEADLINGNIEIKSYSGNLKLNTINGEIDLKVGNASFTAETIHGDIYADESLKLTSDDRHVGQKVQSLSNGSSNKLKLNTINGNMYLRL